MPDLNDPGFTRHKDVAMGYSVPGAGTTKVTIPMAVVGSTAYAVVATPEWNTTIIVVAGAVSFTMTFATPCPDSTSKVRWCVIW